MIIYDMVKYKRIYMSYLNIVLLSSRRVLTFAKSENKRTENKLARTCETTEKTHDNLDISSSTLSQLSRGVVRFAVRAATGEVLTRVKYEQNNARVTPEGYRKKAPYCKAFTPCSV